MPFPDTTEIPGKPCYCGRVGCIETWCSGRAFEAQYTEHKGVELKAAEIMALKRQGDAMLGICPTALCGMCVTALRARASAERMACGTVFTTPQGTCAACIFCCQ